MSWRYWLMHCWLCVGQDGDNLSRRFVFPDSKGLRSMSIRYRSDAKVLDWYLIDVLATWVSISLIWVTLFIRPYELIYYHISSSTLTLIVIPVCYSRDSFPLFVLYSTQIMLSLTWQTARWTTGDRVVINSATVWNLVMVSLATALLAACQAKWGTLVKKVSMAIKLKWLWQWIPHIYSPIFFIPARHSLSDLISQNYTYGLPLSYWAVVK